MDPNMNTPPPPPDGTGVVAASQSATPPPPPDGSGVVAALPGHPTATMSAANPHSLTHGSTMGIQHTDDESVLSSIGKTASNVATGAARGLVGGISGLNDMLDKHLPGDPNEIGRATVRDTLHSLSGQGEGMNTEQQAGYAGETLSEFLLGDEALKALSIPERFAKVAQTFKTIESSPRLMAALKLGSAALKGGTELSPEEAAIVKQYPRLSAFLHLGQQAANAAVVQGVQTTARTGGDIKAGASDAWKTAATVGALHGATGVASHVLGKGRRAAQTLEEMTARGAAAPTDEEVNDQFRNAVQNGFGKEQGTLQNQLDDATSTIQMAGQGAPQQGALTQFAQTRAQAARKALSDQYVQGLKDLSKHIDVDQIGRAHV